MITAIILINAARDRIKTIAEELAALEQMSEVFSVSGSYDLVAIIRVATNDDLADLVTERLARIDGIESTETMLAFKAYSRHDLEAMFSL